MQQLELSLPTTEVYGRKVWQDRAFQMLRSYAQTHSLFLIEEARAAALRAGLTEPCDSRMWGAVTRRAVRAGLIRRVGAAAAVTSNHSVKPVWMSCLH